MMTLIRDLTPCETAIVELVAAGLYNKEIARHLHCSIWTVRAHLSHVYAKLDIRTRVDLTVWFLAQRASKQLSVLSRVGD